MYASLLWWVTDLIYVLLGSACLNWNYGLWILKILWKQQINRLSFSNFHSKKWFQALFLQEGPFHGILTHLVYMQTLKQTMDSVGKFKRQCWFILRVVSYKVKQLNEGVKSSILKVSLLMLFDILIGFLWYISGTV